MEQIRIELTRQRFEQKRRELLSNGVSIPPTGDRGEASKSGVVVGFEFKPGARLVGTLTLRLIDKPFYYPEAAVEAAIREWFSA